MISIWEGKKGKKVAFEHNFTQLWLRRWAPHLFIVNFQNFFNKVSKKWYHWNYMQKGNLQLWINNFIVKPQRPPSPCHLHPLEQKKYVPKPLKSKQKQKQPSPSPIKSPLKVNFCQISFKESLEEETDLLKRRQNLRSRLSIL